MKEISNIRKLAVSVMMMMTTTTITTTTMSWR